ncbi:phage holin family protein [Nocardioides sp. Bht2]|uniref:phage holin family protein n=1 Tax=Nocardioides sp. Bht2 TaxID=3392297 RepID=UPI0039B428C7
MANDPHTAQHSAQDPTTGQLLVQASQEMRELVRSEMRLAQVELTTKAKGIGVGAGMLSGAGLIALYGVGTLLAAAVLALALVMDAWLAALIVGVALLAIAAVVGMVGRSRVQAAAPPAPTETLDNVKQDVAAVKEGLHR